MSAPCFVLPPDLEHNNPGWTASCENLLAVRSSVRQSGLVDLAVIRLLLGPTTGDQAPWTHIHVGKPFYYVLRGLQDHSTRLFKTHTVTAILLLLDKHSGKVCVDFEYWEILAEMCMILWAFIATAIEIETACEILGSRGVDLIVRSCGM
jgi:hypothetical protein